MQRGLSCACGAERIISDAERSMRRSTQKTARPIGLAYQAEVPYAREEVPMQHEILDPHLNLFRRFGLPPGGQEYENNVTHALINTLRLSDPRVTRSVLTELVPEIASVPLAACRT